MRGFKWPIVGAVILAAEVLLDVVGALTVPIVQSVAEDYVAGSAVSAGACKEGAKAPSPSGEHP